MGWGWGEWGTGGDTGGSGVTVCLPRHYSHPGPHLQFSHRLRTILSHKVVFPRYILGDMGRALAEGDSCLFTSDVGNTQRCFPIKAFRGILLV